MGASELLISCPSTRMMRCHARRSSSRSALLRSDNTTSWCGWPFWRKVVRRNCHWPAPPGNIVSTVRTASPPRHSSRPSSAPVRPSKRSLGCASSRSPARLSSRNRCVPSKVKIATSISSITVRRSDVASRVLSRCERSVAASMLTSSSARPSALLSRAPRARVEKSPSRSAASMFEIVCSGRTTRSCVARANEIQQTSTNNVSVHRTLPS